MFKWSDIERQVLGKLFLTQEEAKNQNYWEKFRDLANECLFIIANGVKPKVKELNLITHKRYIEAYIGNNLHLHFIKEGEWSIINNSSATPTISEEFLELDKKLSDGESIILNRKDYAINNVYRITITSGDDNYVNVELNDETGEHKVVAMPYEFLSFSDMVTYLNNKPSTNFKYLSDKVIELTGNGTYKIYINTLYDLITEEDLVRDNVLRDIDFTILQMMITYITYNLLLQDDVQRSMILKNEFELMLSRLDDNVMYQSSSFESIGGWY